MWKCLIMDKKKQKEEEKKKKEEKIIQLLDELKKMDNVGESEAKMKMMHWI